MAGITYTIGADGKPLIEAMDTAQRAVERFKKNVTNNEAAVRVAKLQTEADKARVSGQELLAKKIENEIALEQRLIAIRHSGATQAQKDDLEDHARTQRVLADRQAEIAQAQKLANIQRGNMPGQPMSDGAKRFRMMNVSAQLQDVAVQAQMGTAMSTIVGQQAPQLISALGGTGAMAGAAAGAAIGIAIVAGIGAAVVESKESFKNLVDDAKMAASEISKLSFTATSQKEVEKGYEKYNEMFKNIKAQQAYGQTVGGALVERFSSWFAGDSSPQEKANERELQKSKLAREIAWLNQRSLEISKEQNQVSELIANGDERAIAVLKDKLALEKQIQEIRDSQLSPAAKEAAIEAARNEKNARDIAQQRKEGQEAWDEEQKRNKEEQAAEEEAQKKEFKDYDAWVDRRKKGEQEVADFNVEMQKRIADEEAKARAIEQKDIDEQTKLHEKADGDIAKAREALEERRKSKLTPEKRLAEAKDEMERAREIFKKFPDGSLKQKQAGAFLAEKTMAFQAERDKAVERAMGGSIAEGAVRRSERAEQRARARAERIVTNREINKKRAEMERDRKPQKEINAALDAIRGAKKPEVKDAQADIKKATESSAASLVKILAKLTVA